MTMRNLLPILLLVFGVSITTGGSLSQEQKNSG